MLEVRGRYVPFADEALSLIPFEAYEILLFLFGESGINRLAEELMSHAGKSMRASSCILRLLAINIENKELEEQAQRFINESSWR